MAFTSRDKIAVGGFLGLSVVAGGCRSSPFSLLILEDGKASAEGAEDLLEAVRARIKHK